MPSNGKKNPPSTAEQVQGFTSRFSSVALNSPLKGEHQAKDAPTMRKELLALLENPKAHKAEESRDQFAQTLVEYVRLLGLVDTSDILFEIATNYFGLKTFEVVLIGNAGVGKSSFVKRLVQGNFVVETYKPTHGADVTSIVIQTSVGPILFQVWDTAGAEKNGGLRDAYYIGTHGAILMYEISQKLSYTALDEKYKDLQRVCEGIPTVVAANKVDLKPRRIFENSKFQRTNKLQGYKMSVKRGKNVDQPLLYLARVLTGDSRLRFVAEPGSQKPDPKSGEKSGEAAANQQAQSDAVAEAAAASLPPSNDKDGL